LLRYGAVEDEFEEYVYLEDKEGNLILEKEKQASKVYEKIFLDLQEDEIEFTNSNFKQLYEQIIFEFNTKEELDVKTFVNDLKAEEASEITAILMDEEKNVLHRWEDQEIFVQPRTKLDTKEVNDTILNLRLHLVKQKVFELMENAKENVAEHHQEILEQVIAYKKLEMNIAERIKRVL
jgi:DNA primase